MSFFTKQQIDEIQRLIAARAKRDTDFPSVNNLTDSDLFAFVRNRSNVKITVQDFRRELEDLFVSDITSFIEEMNRLLANETERALAAEAGLQDNIDAEAQTRSAADTALGEAVSAEELRAKAAELSLSDAITAEETRAKAAEKANADAIDNIEEKIPVAASSSNLLVDRQYLDQHISPITDAQIDEIFLNNN